MLDSYRDVLLAKNESGQMVDSAGPIVLGTRLESSLETVKGEAPAVRLAGTLTPLTRALSSFDVAV